MDGEAIWVSCKPNITYPTVIQTDLPCFQSKGKPAHVSDNDFDADYQYAKAQINEWKEYLIQVTLVALSFYNEVQQSSWKTKYKLQVNAKRVTVTLSADRETQTIELPALILDTSTVLKITTSAKLNGQHLMQQLRKEAGMI